MRTGVFLFVFLLSACTPYALDHRSRGLEFYYDVLLKGIPPDAREVQVWIPVLPGNDHQVIEGFRVEPAQSYRIAEDKVYKNKILSVSLKPPLDDSAFALGVHYRLKRFEYANGPGQPASVERKKYSRGDLARFLEADRLVTLSPCIQEMAAEMIRGKKTTMEKARAIYDYVLRSVSYDKRIPGWGQGDTERVCAIRAGNCTDFHSLFISLARASGIPAKFVIGVLLEKGVAQGEIGQYHCWAEFYDEERGWVPVDISEAWKERAKSNYYFGTIGEDHLEFSQGRDIVLEPPQAGAPLNYFVYPYVEVDGREFKGVGILFRFRDVNDQVVSSKGTREMP